MNAAPNAAAAGRQRSGATSTQHSASDIAAVACPLGHDLASTGGNDPWINSGRGTAVIDFRTSVVTLAPSRITAAAIARPGRRRSRAIATGIHTR